MQTQITDDTKEQFACRKLRKLGPSKAAWAFWLILIGAGVLFSTILSATALVWVEHRFPVYPAPANYISAEFASPEAHWLRFWLCTGAMLGLSLIAAGLVVRRRIR